MSIINSLFLANISLAEITQDTNVNFIDPQKT